MFWERFYSLCQRIGKKPNPVGKEIGLSSGIISKWKAGGIPNGETLMKLSRYFHVSTDYLLGLSPSVEIEETDMEPVLSEMELRARLGVNLDKLNSIGIAYLAEYSDYLISKGKYCKLENKETANDSTTNIEN